MPVSAELSRKESEEATILQNKELSMDQYRQKDLHQRKEDGKSKTHVALVGRQKLNEITKKLVKTE